MALMRRVEAVQARYDVTLNPLGGDFLGKGQYGEVYRGVEKGTGQAYALKMLPIADHSAGNATALEEDLVELEILRHVNHRNCVRLHEVLQTPTHLCVVMELCDGGQLMEFIGRRGKLSEDLARDITRQLLDALVYLHCTLNVAHRDLKPENILVTTGDDADRPLVKVVDFGVARYFGKLSIGNCLSDDLERGMSLSHSESEIPWEAAGTALYTAYETLEQLCDEFPSRVSRRGDVQKVDIFSVGIILYLMLSGRGPFTRTLTEVTPSSLYNAVSLGVEFPAMFFRGVSADAKAFIRELLQLDPRQRPTASQALDLPWMRSAAVSREELQLADRPSGAAAGAAIQDAVGVLEWVRSTEEQADASESAAAASANAQA